MTERKILELLTSSSRIRGELENSRLSLFVSGGGDKTFLFPIREYEYKRGLFFSLRVRRGCRVTIFSPCFSDCFVFSFIGQFR